MSVIHKSLAAGRWFTLPLMEQLGHVGSEIDRAFHWQVQGDREASLRAIDRALELIDLTIDDPRHRDRLKEILRMREVVCDYFYGDNVYQASADSLKKYFLGFALAVRKNF